MKLTAQQYAQALFEAVSETAVKDHEMVLDRFVSILAQNGDLAKHPEIEREFQRLDNKKRGIKDAEVTLAKEAELNHSIVEELNKVAGSKLNITKKVDEELIGGVVVRVDDALIDASVRGQLDNLNQQLKS